MQIAGFSVDATRHFQLLKLLDGLTAEDWLADAAALRYRIAPIIATTAEEQRRFYDFFDQLEAEWAEEAARRSTDLPPPPPPPPTPWYKKLSTVQLFTLLTLLLAAIIGLIDFITKTDTPFELAIAKEDISQALKVGDTLIVNIGSDRPDSSGFYWQLQDPATGEIVLEQETEQLNWIVDESSGRYQLILIAPHTNTQYESLADTVPLTIQCAQPPKPVLVSPASAETPSLVTDSTITFAIDQLPEGVIAEWTFSSPHQEVIGQEVTHQFEGIGGNGGYSLKLINDQNPDYCYTVQEDNFRLGTDKAFLPFATFKKDDTSNISSRISWLYWFLALFPLIPAIILFRQWQKALREKEEDKIALDAKSDLPVHDAAPYFIPYLEQEEKIKVPPDFFRIARILRRREEGLRRSFAAKATIEKTVKAGGYPTWQDRALTRPAEYLVLLPSREEGNHQDKLLTRLVQFMQRRDAPLIAYYHDSGFRYCWRPGQEDTSLSLHQLYQRYPAHRLLLLGNAHELVNPHANEQPSLLNDITKKLIAWPRRLLLTTEPPIDWSFQEVLLAEHFRLYPATMYGMIDGLEALDKDEEYQAPPFGTWQEEQQKIAPANSYRYNAFETIEDHEKYLSNDSESFRWLCALAVNARPDWALTIAIGKAIGVTVTHDRLLQLSRIPWLATNEFDNDLRLDLLRLLSKEDEQLARKAVTNELALVKEKIVNSFSSSEWTASHALQQFALQPRSKENKQLISQLLNAGILSPEQEVELDFIVKERIDKKTEPKAAFENIKAWLQWEKPRPQLRLYLWLAAALSALAIAMLLYGGWYNSQKRDAQPDHLFYQSVHQLDSAQVWHNEAVDYLLELDSLATSPEILLEQKSTLEWSEKAVNKLNQAKAMRSPQPYLLADSNIIALRSELYILQVNLAHSLSPSDSLYEAFLNESYTGLKHLARQTKPTDRRHLDLLHGSGVAAWYLHQSNKNIPGLLDTARVFYDSLLLYSDSTYFDSLSVEKPINLETLLNRYRPRRYLHAVLLDANTKQPISGVALDLGNNQETISDSKGIVSYDYAELIPEMNQIGQVGIEIQVEGYHKKVHLFELFRTRNSLDTVYLEPDSGELIQEEANNIDPVNSGRDVVLEIFTFVSKTELNLAGAAAKLIDPLTKKVLEERTNAEGNDFHFSASLNRSYILEVNKKGYATVFETITVIDENLSEGDDKITFDVFLELLELPDNFESSGPLYLYFENDHPNPNSISRTTDLEYIETNVAYYEKKEEYIQAFTEGMTPEEAFISSRRYDDFFDREVRGGRYDLEAFAQRLLELLNKGNIYGIKLSGFTAPIKSPYYNEFLAKRRIATVVNFFKRYEDGALMPFMDSGAFSITSIPYGESRADPKVSDRMDDPKNSIYNISAAIENRVVVSVEFIDTDKDGIFDRDDQCPNTPQGATVDDKGCEITNAATIISTIEKNMIPIPGGTFTMGCLNEERDGECENDESPSHSVTISTFYMAKHELTVGEYLIFADETGGNYPEWLEEGNNYHVETGSDSYYKDKGYGREAINLPIAGVSWNDAVAYCQWLSQKTGRNYHLPTEAEWEYAARGGEQGEKDAFKYSGGNELGEVAWYSDNSDSKPQRVGQKKPNQLGLYDMSGNLWEWCVDWYDSDYYKNSPQQDPKGADTGSDRVNRGGSWYDSPQICRAAYRGRNTPTLRNYNLGFRLARSF